MPDSKRVEISLTDFVDFVVRTGSPKLTKVREIFNRGTYLPAFDYWRQLRKHISEVHLNKSHLGAILDSVDAKKKHRYSAALSGYQKLLKKLANAPCSPPPFGRWEQHGLVVKVNPELCFRVDGKPHIIKLYFKEDQLTPRRLEAIFQLMRESVCQGPFQDSAVSVIDVAKGKLLTAGDSNAEYSILLVGEAAAFMAMWTAMSATRRAQMAAGA